MDREKMGCGGDRRGVKYCNYHPIDFHWLTERISVTPSMLTCLAVNPLLRERENPFSPFIHSVIN